MLGCFSRSPARRTSALDAAASGDCVALAASFARSGAAEACAARDSDGDTALHIAALNGAIDAAGLLIASGADVCAVNSRGETPLHHACTRAGSNELVSALLDAGCAPNARSALDARTALHHAAQRGDAASVAALLRAGASPRQATRSGLTPRELAARRSDGDGAAVAELLREAERRASAEMRRRCAEMGTSPPRSPSPYRTPTHAGASDGAQRESGTPQVQGQ